MNKNHAVLLTTALLLHAGTSQAQEVVAVPPGADQILPVKKGSPSPIDGQVFSNETSLRWANWLLQYRNLVKTNDELQKKLCEIDTGNLQGKLDLERDQYKKVTEELQKKLASAQEEAANPPFLHTATFGAIAGTVGTVLLLGGAVAVVNALK